MNITVIEGDGDYYSRVHAVDKHGFNIIITYLKADKNECDDFKFYLEHMDDIIEFYATPGQLEDIGKAIQEALKLMEK